WADYNNDGKLDLVSISSSAGVRLLRNDGNGSFTSVTLTAVSNPLWVNWVDYDGDLDLDLYLATGATGGRVLRYDGGDTFTLVTPSGLGGVDTETAAWADYDGDGDQDVFIGSDSSLICLLYDNNGGGT